jgi:HTH-type transcriptional regulator/antitoxin HipB
MKKNVFWDKKYDLNKIKKILSNDEGKRFIEFAALLLSRTNDPKEVFADYINITVFCKNWRSIKRKMRENKWSDKRIDFWDTIYKTALKTVPGIREDTVRYKKRKPINENVHEIGQAIRKERKKKGWTQKEFAKKAKLSQQTISLIEGGNLNFSFKTFMKVSKVLDLKVILRAKEENESAKYNTVTY